MIRPDASVSRRTPPRSQCTSMNLLVHIHVHVLLLLLLLLLLFHLPAAQEDFGALSELPFSELLAQKKVVEGGSGKEGAPVALAFVGEMPREETKFKGMHRVSVKKTFHEEDYDDEKGHLSKKKEKDKLHDVLNTSIMALSYLAFGGYLLCMIASALREKRRRYATYPTAGPTTNNQFAQVLHQYVSHRPLRPFIRFPAVTVHQGGKKRRRRLAQRYTPSGDDSPHLSITDYVEIFFPGNS